MVRALGNWALCLVLAAGIAGLAQAQLPTRTSASPADVPDTQGTVTTRVGKLLEGCGYKPAYRKLDNGVPFHSVRVKHGDWTFSVNVEVSPSGRKVWLYTTVKQLKAGQKLAEDRLLELLDVTKLVGTGHFVYLKEGRELRYASLFDSRGLNAAELQLELNHFVDGLTKMEALWNFTVTGDR